MPAARYILDTDICIYIRSKKPAALRARLAKLAPGEAVLSVITYGELRFGVEKSRDRELSLRKLTALAAAIPVLSLPEGAAETYGRIRAALEKAGRMIGGNDLWIAAHAIATELVLVTNNEREFSRIADLRLENWARLQ
jgi:tRNA(fMet)-specific endonuclease VapC